MPPMMETPALCINEHVPCTRSERDLPRLRRVGIAFPAAHRDQKDAFVEQGVGSVSGGDDCP